MSCPLRQDDGGVLGRLRHPARPPWAAYACLAALLAVYLGLLIADPDRSYSTWLDGWSVDAFEIVASGLCLYSALTGSARKAAPIVLGAALLAWSLGDTVLTVESLGGAQPPVPSAADAFYLAFFPLAYVAVVLLMRGEVRRINSPSWLDSAVAGFGAASVCAAFAFHGIVAATGSSALAVATDLAYPVGDLLLLVLVVASTALLSGRRKAPWLMLASGMAINVAGDTFNLLGSASGAPHVGAVVNGIAWPMSILLMSAAVWLPGGYADPRALPRPPGFLMPGVASGAALAVLAIGALDSGLVNSVAISLATATLLIVGVRLYRSVRGLRSMTRRHEQHSVTDYLTGLGNRRFLFSVLNAFFAEASSTQTSRPLAFLFIDLNRFKEINDSFGHPVGDEILGHVGRRLSAALRDTDTLVRIGGDEFAAVLLDADRGVAQETAQRLSAELEAPFALETISAQIDASIGIALAPEHASDPQSLLSYADLAMYRAKTARQPFATYEADLSDGGDLLRLAEELSGALDRDELCLYYQPQLNLRTGDMFASEALLRWMHPTRGVIPPLTFLPLAEQTGLMGRITGWVLERSLRQCAQWRAQAKPAVVAVNVSPGNLLEHGFTAAVSAQLALNGLPAEALVLEITETSVISDLEKAQRVIAELAELGVQVSIDDFGTGFTSLAYLSSLAVRELKLDRAFIEHVADRDLQLVRSTIALGHALGLRIVAEGIEDADTLALVADLGCDIGQGYFIGRPAPPAEPSGAGASAGEPSTQQVLALMSAAASPITAARTAPAVPVDGSPSQPAGERA